MLSPATMVALGGSLAILVVFLALIYAFPFRFVRLESAGRPSPTAVGSAWTHSPSGMRLLPGFRSCGRFRDENGDGHVVQYQCEILENAQTHQPVFKCSMERNGVEIVEMGSSASAVTKKFLQALHVDIKRNKSGPEFFGYTRGDVQTAIRAAGTSQPHPEGAFQVSYNDVESAVTHSTIAGGGHGSTRKTTVMWGGLIDAGKSPSTTRQGSELWQVRAAGQGPVLTWRPGYHSRRVVSREEDQVNVDCRVLEPDDVTLGPQFRLEYHGTNIVGGIIESRNCTQAVVDLFERLGVPRVHKYTGPEFFGLHLKTVSSCLLPRTVEQPPKENATDPNIPRAGTNPPPADSGIWRRAYNVCRRNAGIASGLSDRFCRGRFDLAARAIRRLVGEDFSRFISYIAVHHSDILFNGIAESPSMLTRLQRLLRSRPVPVSVSTSDSAEIIVAGGLSQRSYKSVQKMLKKKNIRLARHEAASTHLKNLDVGTIELGQHTADFTPQPGNNCICASTDLCDTLMRLVSTQAIYEAMTFPDEGRQKNLFDKLRQLNNDLFSGLRDGCRTLFLRQTGDNYRSFRLPTEQMSFSVLNLKNLVGSPVGQILERLWRGDENRKLLEAHCHGLFRDLEKLAKEGIDLKCWGQDMEHFNVVVLYVADLPHLQYVLGRVALTATFGCWRCKKEQRKWGQRDIGPAEALTVCDLVKYGDEALKELGPNPSDDSNAYRNWHQSHYGQIAPPLFSALVQQTMPPCALHLILAIHRLFWKVIHSVAKLRNQEPQIVTGLRAIGCHYLAYQLNGYYKSKGKYYDGSTTLRMTGNDCKRLEAGARKFVEGFLGNNETFHSNRSATKLEQLLTGMEKWASIAQDLRSTQTTEERVASFQTRVDEFYEIMKVAFPTECSDKLLYVHIMRDHIASLMRFWFDTMGWGYGMFSGSAGEHLNKRLKIYEAEHTSQGTDRFKKILHMFRVALLHYPSTTIKEPKSEITCSACGIQGHTKKNKICPNHINQQDVLEFPNSDDEQ